MIARAIDGKPEGLTPDDILDNITLYWLTNTAVSSARLYWDHSLTAKKGFFESRASPSRWPSAPIRARSIPRRAAGQRKRIPSSFITTSFPKALTSPRGSSRNTIQRKFARVSDHCANQPEDFGARDVRANSSNGID